MTDGVHLPETDLATLRTIERRVLWLAMAMVHHANRVRPNPSGLKVGGHQASSASIVTLMTSLWFQHLRSGDRVAVKPHASPVLHALNYLLGELDAGYLPRLRAAGGLQSYPSRTKDPDPVDYSTGSEGLGATATLWGSVTRRVASRFRDVAPGRQYAIVGDAELDEGAIWEAVVEPLVGQLGDVVWIVDVNRQSLDRVVPGISILDREAMFEAAGWQVLTVKYGALLDELFRRPGGDALRRRIDEMQNPEFQRLLRCGPDELRARLPGGDAALSTLIETLDDATLGRAVRDLGGHDLAAIDAALSAVDDSVPTIVFAYTIKGYATPLEGHPQNHSALLTDEEFTELGVALGADPADPWAAFATGSAPGDACAAAAHRIAHRAIAPSALTVPSDVDHTPSGVQTTQAALGRALFDLARSAPEAARRVVTVSPDVSSSTNLAGWVNKVGVWSPRPSTDWFADDRQTLLHWHEDTKGQHIELGIAETNAVGLAGELGAAWREWGETLFPVVVMYDPFVARALEPWAHTVYAGGQSILVGTPSGVSLAPEGGAHQSVVTPSIGLELPGVIGYEPAFAIEVAWILLDAFARMGREGGTSTYLRLSTRPVDQGLATVPEDRAAREERRRGVLAGAYVLRDVGAPDVTIAAMGAMVPTALEAADALAREGTQARVLCVTSPGRLYAALQSRQGRSDGPSWILDEVSGAHAPTPLVTVLDGHPHTLSFLATIDRVPHVALGVTSFGQSGSLDEAYEVHGIDASAIVAASHALCGVARV